MSMPEELSCPASVRGSGTEVPDHHRSQDRQAVSTVSTVCRSFYCRGPHEPVDHQDEEKR